MRESLVNKSIPTAQLRGELINIVAATTYLPKEIVEGIINTQFQYAREATNKYTEVYLYRLGRFIIRPSKVAECIRNLVRAIEKLEYQLKIDDTLSQEQKISIINQIGKNREDLVYIKSKVRVIKPKRKRPDREFLKDIEKREAQIINITDDFNDYINGND